MDTTVSSTWNALYAELLAFVVKKVRDRATAEDIVHDVFVKVHAKADQVRHADKIIGWIYQITRNAVADYFRKNEKNIAPINIDWESGHSEFNTCVAHCLAVLMRTLPEEYRVPLYLTEVEGLSQYEVADRLKISYSGARSRVQRARKMLKNKLTDLYSIKTDSYGNVIVCENKVPCGCSRNC